MFDLLLATFDCRLSSFTFQPRSKLVKGQEEGPSDLEEPTPNSQLIQLNDTNQVVDVSNESKCQKKAQQQEKDRHSNYQSLSIVGRFDNEDDEAQLLSTVSTPGMIGELDMNEKNEKQMSNDKAHNPDNGEQKFCLVL